jgi:hypothetical protein
MQLVIRINHRFRAFRRWRNSWFIVDFQFCNWYIFCDSAYYQLHFSPNRNHVNLYRLLSNTNDSFLVNNAIFLLLCEWSQNPIIYVYWAVLGLNLLVNCAFSEWDRKRCHDVMIRANSVIKNIYLQSDRPQARAQPPVIHPPFESRPSNQSKSGVKRVTKRTWRCASWTKSSSFINVNPPRRVVTELHLRFPCLPLIRNHISLSRMWNLYTRRFLHFKGICTVAASVHVKSVLRNHVSYFSATTVW